MTDATAGGDTSPSADRAERRRDVQRQCVAHSFEVFEKAGLRMYQVRDLLGVTQQTIASWLRQRTAPRPALLGALCQLAADTEVLLENGQLPLPQMSPRRWRHLYPKLYARLYRYEAEQCFSPYVC